MICKKVDVGAEVLAGHRVVMIEVQEALAGLVVETESQVVVDSIVMVTGYAQNAAIRILHGERNVIAAMRQNQTMEATAMNVEVLIVEDLTAEVLIEAVDVLAEIAEGSDQV